MKNALIVGGGIIGLTTALELQRRGFNVTLAEKNRIGETGTGAASGASGGALIPFPPWRCPPPTAGLYGLGQTHWKCLIEELRGQGEEIDITRNNLLCLTPNKRIVSELTKKPYWDFRVLSAKKLANSRPSLNIETDGILFPAAYRIEPRMALEGFHRVAVWRDVLIRENCEIREIQTDQGRVSGARTDGDTINAGVVVLCAGAWLTSLLPQPHRIPEVRPVRGQMIEYDTGPGVLNDIVWSENPKTKKSHYLIPCVSGRILVGSTLEESGFDNSTTEEARAELSDFAVRMLPELAQRQVRHHWAGLRPATSRATPCIGAHPEIDGLFINGGHFRDGIALAPLSAYFIGQLICGKTITTDMRPFGFDG